MTPTLADYRKMAGVSQREMATQMCIPRRTLEDIEAGISAFRPVHDTAAKMALLRIAAGRTDVSFLPEGLQEIVRLIADAMKKQESPAG